MKNKIVSLFLILFLLPNLVMAVDSNSLQTDNLNNNLIVSEELKQEDLTISSEQNPEVTTETNTVVSTKNLSYKKPLSKRKLVKKFLLAMLGVGISAFLVFFILTIYNRIRGIVVNQVKTPDGETPLTTPNDFEEAVKTFLNKTDWKGY